MVSHHERAQRYLKRYAQGVILRSHSLEQYNQFLENLGEKQSLEKIVEQIIQRKRLCKILDVGCGNANALKTLKKMFEERIHTIGMDLLPPETREGLDEFIEGDVHTIPIPTHCDLILSFRALHEMGNLHSLIPKIAHSLDKGGRGYLWLRMLEMVGQKPLFVGEMNKKEEKALVELGVKKEIEDCQVMVQPVEIPIPVNNENDPRETAIGGYIVLLHRPL
jgi:SAM-dependent methyltransferase